MSSTDPNSVIAVGAVMPALGIIAVVLRFYVRTKYRHRILIDDWLLIPALILTVGMGASLIAGVRLHAVGYPTPLTGDPNNPLTPILEVNSAITITSKIEYALQLMQIVALGLVKLSFLFFYRRIFVTGVSKTSKWFSRVTWGLIILISVWTIGFFFALLFSCKGHWSAFWSSVVDLATQCVKTLNLEMALATTDFATDVIIMILPIPKIWALHMSTNRKITVSGVFLLGAVAVAASIVRMNQFITVIEIDFDPHKDEDLHLTSNLYWSMVESGLGLIAVCLPTFRPLFGTSSLQSMLDGFRSAFSLRSQSSSSQAAAAQVQELSGKHFKNNEGSSETFTPIVGHHTAKFETYAMHDRVSGDAPDCGGIVVQNSFSRVEN